MVNATLSGWPTVTERHTCIGFRLERSNPGYGLRSFTKGAFSTGGAGMLRDWWDSSAGLFGCFAFFIGILCVSVWIMWQIMESAIPG
jgi:hypothetical protein